MLSSRMRLHLATAAAVLAAGGLPAGASAVVPLPATVEDFEPPVRGPNAPSVFPAIDYGPSGKIREAETAWRIVEGTGNCCETFVTITPTGRLLDFGGDLIKYTDDRGATWKVVRPLTPLINGEGAIVAAPGGDVLGVQWDPYSGDHLQFYKYEAGTGEWRYTEMPVHEPLYDREWISVMPGPVTVDGKEHEYVSFVKGGPLKEGWFYSTDGLTYTGVTSKELADLLEGTETVGPLPVRADSDNDWSQANSNGGMTGFAGGLLAERIFSRGWSLLDDEFRWSSFNFFAEGDGEPDGRFQMDSAGRIHNVIPAPDGFSFDYRVSSDGGVSWNAVKLPLPDSYKIEEWDFRANKQAGVTAVAVRAQEFVEENSLFTDQDFLFKLDISKTTPRLVRRHEVGLGDLDSAGSFGPEIRLDFGSVAVFPDGRVAVSFLDSTTQHENRNSPAIAIEGDTEIVHQVAEEPEVTPVLGEPYASYPFEVDEQGWSAEMPWTRSSPGVSNGNDDLKGQSFGITGPQYLNFLNSSLTSPAINTEPGLTVLQFWSWLDLEPNNDFLYVEWRAEGPSWLPLTRLTGGGGTWAKNTAGFESPGGPVQVRLRLRSDLFCSGIDPRCGRPYGGVRIDDVVIGRQRIG